MSNINQSQSGHHHHCWVVQHKAATRRRNCVALHVLVFMLNACAVLQLCVLVHVCGVQRVRVVEVINIVYYKQMLSAVSVPAEVG